MRLKLRLGGIARVRLLAGAAALAAATLSTGATAADVKAGQASAAMCLACHQADGHGKAVPQGEPWPALAGMDAGYLFKQLQDFKAGARSDASMEAFAKMLTEEQMRNVSAYYASLPPRPPADGTKADPELLAHGEKLALHGDWDRYIVPCISCHGVGNAGVGSEFPRLTAQLPEYLHAQLLAYRDGKRTNDPLDLMSTIARRMTDRDIEAVSAWLATQTANTPSETARN